MEATACPYCHLAVVPQRTPTGLTCPTCWNTGKAPQETSAPAETAAAPATKAVSPCPYCGESISQDATACPFCASDLLAPMEQQHADAPQVSIGAAPYPVMAGLVWIGLLGAVASFFISSDENLVVSRLVVLATAIVIGIDAAMLRLKRLGRARLALTSVERMGAWEWAIVSALLFVVFAPLYAIKRSTLWYFAESADHVGYFASNKERKRATKDPRFFSQEEIQDLRARRSRDTWTAIIAVVLVFAALIVAVVLTLPPEV